MQNFRTFVVGFTVGGALGANIGAYIASQYSLTFDGSLANIGLFVGGILGIFVSLLIVTTQTTNKSRSKENTMPSPQRYPELSNMYIGNTYEYDGIIREYSSTKGKQLEQL